MWGRKRRNKILPKISGLTTFRHQGWRKERWLPSPRPCTPGGQLQVGRQGRRPGSGPLSARWAAPRMTPRRHPRPTCAVPVFSAQPRAPAAGGQYLLQRGSYLSFRPFLNDLGCEPRRAPWSTTGPERSRGAGMFRRVRPAPTPPPTWGRGRGPLQGAYPFKRGGLTQRCPGRGASLKGGPDIHLGLSKDKTC